jgi:hypothetical protein
MTQTNMSLQNQGWDMYRYVGSQSHNINRFSQRENKNWISGTQASEQAISEYRHLLTALD